MMNSMQRSHSARTDSEKSCSMRLDAVTTMGTKGKNMPATLRMNSESSEKKYWSEMFLSRLEKWQTVLRIDWTTLGGLLATSVFSAWKTVSSTSPQIGNLYQKVGLRCLTVEQGDTWEPATRFHTKKAGSSERCPRMSNLVLRSTMSTSEDSSSSWNSS